jgi:NTP pyrophosphatase (non-canonical NTP hydrolase)
MQMGRKSEEDLANSLDISLRDVHDWMFAWSKLANIAYENSKKKGFHDAQRSTDPDPQVRLMSNGMKLALLHSEVSEALEALRKGNPESVHLGGFSGVEEELADLIIRIMDDSTTWGMRVGEAVLQKMVFNAARPHLHGGKLA